MALEIEIPEGWTAPIDLQLDDDGVASTGIGADTLTAEARDRGRNAVTLTSDLAVLTASDGSVRLTPDTGDFTAAGSPYELRIKRSFAGGGIAWYPSGEAIILKVRSWP